uniref:Prostaglandin E2 receptor EP4 subtype n=1 Tax=Lygus hesperus TaxID=30085 RepID=A0A0A9W3D8_LYGHE
MEMVTNSTLIIAPPPAMSIGAQSLINSVYIFGIINNLGALGYLFGSEHAPKNARTSLVLKCLAFNDLLAVLGMWTQMNLRNLFPFVSYTHWFCVFRVVWRSFGLGSGCIVCVMAIDRWLALTRPFFYQKYITVSCIKKAIFTLWATDFVLVCLPFFGFGLYFTPKTSRCARYKQAKTPIDIAYAYLYFAFGTLLCLCLVLCNVAVMRSLTCQKKAQSKNQKVLIRRISKNRDLTASACTTEEIAFARVMLLLCGVFLFCWLPQLITIPVAQMTDKCNWYINLADLILALHFVIDPYFYVLQQWKWFHSLCRKRPGSRGNSVKTTTHEELVTL